MSSDAVTMSNNTEDWYDEPGEVRASDDIDWFAPPREPAPNLLHDDARQPHMREPSQRCMLLRGTSSVVSAAMVSYLWPVFPEQMTIFNDLFTVKKKKYRFFLFFFVLFCFVVLGLKIIIYE